MWEDSQRSYYYSLDLSKIPVSPSRVPLLFVEIRKSRTTSSFISNTLLLSQLLLQILDKSAIFFQDFQHPSTNT